MTRLLSGLFVMVVLSQVALGQIVGQEQPADDAATTAPTETETAPTLEGAHSTTETVLLPKERRAGVAEQFSYVRQELKRRALYLDMLAHPEKFSSILKDPQKKMEMEVAIGEMMLLARRAFLIPSHLADKLVYTPQILDDGKIVIKVSIDDPKRELGSLTFSSDGYFLSHDILSDQMQYLADENKKTEKREVTNQDFWVAEARELANRLQYATARGQRVGYKNFRDEGQFEFLAKELFEVRDKSTQIRSVFHQEGSSILIQFRDRDANQALGVMAFHYEIKDGKKQIKYVNLLPVDSENPNKKLGPALMDNANGKLGKQNRDYRHLPF